MCFVHYYFKHKATIEHIVPKLVDIKMNARHASDESVFGVVVVVSAGSEKLSPNWPKAKDATRRCTDLRKLDVGQNMQSPPARCGSLVYESTMRRVNQGIY